MFCMTFNYSWGEKFIFESVSSRSEGEEVEAKAFTSVSAYEYDALKGTRLA
jgi:hypothetical protein